MAVDATLIAAGLCGVFLALTIPTSYWFYTVPKRYAETARRLAHLVEK